ncbi:MAG TPA: hypothetical protein VE464_15870 [Streptosporangiaceae bacterium]|nr:hypothetical protein [Streptosporangiaceae bacterium]
MTKTFPCAARREEVGKNEPAGRARVVDGGGAGEVGQAQEATRTG